MTWRPRFSHVFTAAALILAASTVHAAEIELRGTVVLPSGEARSGVRIHLMREASRYEQARTSLAGEIHPPALATTVSDSRGRYRLVAPEAGIFRLLVEADGCFPVTAGPLALTGPLELAPIVPPVASVVRVRVLDADNRPVSGAWVQARGTAERRFSRELPKGWAIATRTMRTAADGWASLPKLPGEPLSVLAFRPGAAEVWAEGASSEIILRLGRNPVSLSVLGAGTDGQPLSGALVQVGEGGWTSAMAGADGRAAVAVAPVTPTRIRLLAPDGRRLGVDLSPSASGISSHRITLPALQTLVGTVRVAGTPGPLAGALVWSAEEPGLWTVADRNGQYRLAIPAALRSLRIEAAGYISQQIRLAEAEVRKGRAPTIALQQAILLTGKAVDESGAALEGVAVAAVVEGAPPGLAPAAAVAWGFSDRAGRFELRSLSPGTPYRVQGVQRGLFGVPQTVTTALAGSPPPPLRLVLLPSQGVRGRVIDPDARPVSGAEVLLRPTMSPKRSEPLPIEALRPEEEAYRARTDSRGVFTVRDLPALQVDVIARKPGFAPSVVRGLQIRPGKAPQPAGDIVLHLGARFAGRVVDRAGRPIGGAAVYQVQQIEDLDRLEARLRERQPAAVSTGDGGFALEDLSPGAPLNLVVSAQGFAPAGLRGVRAPAAEPVVLRLEPTSAVRGRVVDENGAGIPGARASLEWQSSLPELPRVRTGEHVVRTAVADREGRIELRNVPAGTAEIGVSADGFVAADHLQVGVPQGPKDEWTVVLKRGATLEGRISTRQGDPVGGARISAAQAMAFSDDDGRYLVTGAPLGQVQVEILHPSYPRRVQELKIESGSNVFDVQFEAGHRVTGVVLTATGEPVPGASVSLETIDQGRGSRAYRAHTSMAGVFELSAVADGDYRIAASAEGFAEAKPPGVIAVRGEDRDHVEVILDRGASIVGRVLGLPPEELAWVEVSAQGEEPDAETPTVRPDAEGRFALRHLPLGNWQIRAQQPQRQRSVEARAVLRAHGEEAVRDLRFGGGLKLSGMVDFADEPLPGALVTLRAQSRSTERSVQTDYQGEFELADLDADRYYLSVTDRKTLALHNEEIVLDEDQQVEIHLHAGTVAGAVFNSSSREPIAGAFVSLRPLSGADFMIGSTSEQDGGFVLPRIPEGLYRLSTKAEGYTAAEQEIEVAGGAEISGLEVRLAPTQGLDVIVRLSSGQPPALVHLRATSATSGVIAETRSVSADGRVRLATLPAGEWDLWIAAPGSGSRQARVRAPGEAVAVDLPPAGRLAVRVSELAESSLIGTVSATNAGGQPFATLTFGGEIATAWPLKAGAAVVEGLPAGAWTVVVHAPDGRTWTKAVATNGRDGEVSFE